jgi:hypothetical protein
LRLPSCKIYFFDLPHFCWRGRQKSTATSAKNLTFCLPRQQKGGKSNK